MNQIRNPTVFQTRPDSRSDTLSVGAETTNIEWLLIRSYRAWIKGLQGDDSRYWNDVWNGFLAEFGTRDGKQALAWFVRMINVLQTHAGRALRYHHPGCPCKGDDERLFVAVVAACQHGDAGEARECASQLVTPDGVGELIASAGQLALMLANRRPRLPMRPTEPGQLDLQSLPALSTAIN